MASPGEVYITKDDAHRALVYVHRGDPPKQPYYIYRVLFCNDYVVLYEQLRLTNIGYESMCFYEAHTLCGPRKFRRDFRELWFELDKPIV